MLHFVPSKLLDRVKCPRTGEQYIFTVRSFDFHAPTLYRILALILTSNSTVPDVLSSLRFLETGWNSGTSWATGLTYSRVTFLKVKRDESL